MARDNDTDVDVARLLDRLAGGDEAARDLLVARALGRLTVLARRQRRGFPAVARWELTDDVVQGVALRLRRALRDVRPADPRAFFGLCSWHIRNELLQLHRKHFGPEGVGRNHASPKPDPSAGARHDTGAPHPADTTHEPGKLARWTEVHERIAALPDDLREATELLWYQDLTQTDAARVLGVAVKTVARRWREARLRLAGLLREGGV
jgi:RNA polymerase sigma-70 factor (ECF subfamily)